MEAEFPLGAAFQAALGITGYAAQFNLQYADLRPDIIAALLPGTFSHYITPDGTIRYSQVTSLAPAGSAGAPVTQ